MALSRPRMENPVGGRQEERRNEPGAGLALRRTMAQTMWQWRGLLKKVAIKRNQKPGRRQAQRHLCAGLGCGPEEKKEPPGDESHRMGIMIP